MFGKNGTPIAMVAFLLSFDFWALRMALRISVAYFHVSTIF